MLVSGAVVILVIDVMVNGKATISLQRSAMVRHLVPAQVPLILALLLAQIALHPFAFCVNIDNVLFEIEFVAEDPITDWADAWLTAVPKFGHACPYQKFGAWKEKKRNVLSV